MSVVTLIRVWPRVAATGVVVAVLLAGGNNGAPYPAGYRAGIMAEPRFQASISISDSGWAARAVPAVGAMQWMPADAAGLADMAGLYWRDARIEIDRVTGGQTVRRLTGSVAEAQVGSGVLGITCADMTARIDKPVCPDTFSGKGGIEGGDFATGRVKRRSYGRVWNVEGRLLDKAYGIYEFGDPALPLQACTAFRDKGRAGPLGIVGWQGSIDATLNALRAAVPQSGGGVFAPSIACGKWWKQPSGPLTADLQGIASGYSETAAGIAAQLLDAIGGAALSDAAGAAALRPGACGLHVGDGSETVPSALDRLFQRMTLIWMPNAAGLVDVRPWTFTNPAASLQAEFISRDSSLKPVSSCRVGYKHNERIHGDGEISAALLASDIVYEDGTTAEDWKPAEQGADKTSNHTANDVKNVFGRPVEEVISDLDLNGMNWHDLVILTDTRNAQMMARTTLEGQAIGTVVTNFKAEQTENNQAVAETFNLQGAKSGDGQSWLWNTNSVMVAPGVSMSQYMQGVSAAIGDVEGSVTDLRQVLVGADGSITAKAVMALQAGNKVAGFVFTNTGAIASADFLFDAVRFLKPDGSLMWGYDPGIGKVVMGDVVVNTLEARTVKTESIDVNSVTGVASVGFPDVTVTSTETTIAEIDPLMVGDEEDGRALANVNFVQDGTVNEDTAMRIRIYLDTGSGYVMYRTWVQGIRGLGGADSKWAMPVTFSVPILANGTVRLKITAQASNIGGGGNLLSSAARAIQVDIFQGFR